MLLDISDEDKARVGYFINYKRKSLYQLDKQHYNIESFIDGICSKQTYNRLSKGQNIKNNEIYDTLLARLGYRFQYDNESTDNMLSQIKAFIPYLSRNQSPLFRKHVKALLPELAHYQFYALESVIYETCSLVTQEHLNINHLPYMMKLFPMLTKDLQQMLGFYILYLIVQSNESEPPITFLKASGLYESAILYNRYMILNILIKWEYYYDAVIYCEQILTICRNQHNAEIERTILETKAILMVFIQPKSFEEVITTLDRHAGYQNHTKTETKHQLYYTCGVYYYQKKAYQKAQQYFYKIRNEPLYNAGSYLFLNHIATILQQPIAEEVQYEMTLRNANKNESVDTMCRYYQRKQVKEDPQVLEDYLWKYRSLILKDVDPLSVMERMIAVELQWISEKTGNKKRLYQFNKRK